MEDFIILRTGYNSAINDVMNIVDKIEIDELDRNILKDKILRKQRLYLAGNENSEYEGNLYKYYNKENNIGYIIYDDIYELKGVCILINDGTYTEINDKELIFARNNYELILFEKFKTKDLMNLRYQEWINKFQKI